MGQRDRAAQGQLVRNGIQSGRTGEHTHVLLVTGLSGAGKSSVLKALEDLGFEAVDNLPLVLLPNLLGITDDNPEHEPSHAIAVGIDTRTRAFRADRFEAELRRLRGRPDLKLTLVFLDCSNDVLVKRFTETRRRHPLAVDRPVIDGILRERVAMERIRAHADYVFDTTDLTIHELKRAITHAFSHDSAEQGSDRLVITLSSFAYPRGLPRDADLVFDVRFLHNPHYVDELRPLTGRDGKVAAYIATDPAFAPFLEKLQDLVSSLLPLYKREGKAYLTIAFGCTGGRHRSVLLAEVLGGALTKQGYRVNVLHRELERALEPSSAALGDTP